MQKTPEPKPHCRRCKIQGPAEIFRFGTNFKDGKRRIYSVKGSPWCVYCQTCCEELIDPECSHVQVIATPTQDTCVVCGKIFYWGHRAGESWTCLPEAREQES